MANTSSLFARVNQTSPSRGKPSRVTISKRPYKTVIEETQKLTGVEVARAYVDKGYRGHNAPKPLRVYRSGQKRGVFGVIKHERRRPSAIEAVIGHLKTNGHRGRNYLKGRHGDRANLIRATAGYNLRLPPSRPPVAEGSFGRNPRRPPGRIYAQISPRSGLLTDDRVVVPLFSDRALNLLPGEARPA